MIKKYAGFVICILLSLGIMSLALIKEDIYCSRAENSCVVKSGIQLLGIKFNEEKFPSGSLKRAICKREYRLTKSGKKAYFSLKIEAENSSYSLGTFMKYQQCEEKIRPINSFISKKTDSFHYNSGVGFEHVMGFFMGFLLLIIAVSILRTPNEQENDNWDDI